MTLIRWNPWNELFSLHSQMDRLFDEALGGKSEPGGALEYSSLPVDIHQSADAYTVVASVPGFRPEDVEVTVDDGMLTIRGRHQTDTTSDGEWLRRERRVSSVFRQVGLPAEIRAEEITANFDNGVLSVRIPRAQKAEPKRIPVSVSSPQTKVIDAPQQKGGAAQG